jgi:hypothetical protein
MKFKKNRILEQDILAIFLEILSALRIMRQKASAVFIETGLLFYTTINSQ